MKIFRFTFYDNVIKKEIFEDVYVREGYDDAYCIKTREKAEDPSILLKYFERMPTCELEADEFRICNVDKIDTDSIAWSDRNAGWCYTEDKSIEYIKSILKKFYNEKKRVAKESYEDEINNINKKLKAIDEQ